MSCTRICKMLVFREKTTTLDSCKHCQTMLEKTRHWIDLICKETKNRDICQAVNINQMLFKTKMLFQTLYAISTCLENPENVTSMGD